MYLEELDSSESSNSEIMYYIHKVLEGWEADKGDCILVIGAAKNTETESRFANSVAGSPSNLAKTLVMCFEQDPDLVRIFGMALREYLDKQK